MSLHFDTALLTSAPAFQVGDRVVYDDDSCQCDPDDLGTVTEVVYLKDSVLYLVTWDDESDPDYFGCTSLLRASDFAC